MAFCLTRYVRNGMCQIGLRLGEDDKLCCEDDEEIPDVNGQLTASMGICAQVFVITSPINSSICLCHPCLRIFTT